MILEMCRDLCGGFVTVVAPVLNWVLEKTERKEWFGGHIATQLPYCSKWDCWREGNATGVQWGNWGGYFHTPSDYKRLREGSEKRGAGRALEWQKRDEVNRLQEQAEKETVIRR